MGERRILVIGSQCEMLSKLDFLPRAAEDFYEVMCDPNIGACVPALEDDHGLLIDPSVADTKAALKAAYQRAAQDEATLFIAYIGHGEHAGDDFYLMPKNAENPPDADTAVHLTSLIKEAHRKAPSTVDGLGMLIDTCYAGVAGFSAAHAWVNALKGTLRFEILTAAADRPAANGCFTKTLVNLLRHGVSAQPAEHLQCMHVRPLIENLCLNQVPQNPSYNPDQTLWLGKNAARRIEPWAQTPLADEIQRLTVAYQATPALAQVVAMTRVHGCVAVVAGAGAGKSALAAALGWPKVADGIVNPGFVQGIFLLNEATTPHELARGLAAQLASAVPGFEDAQQAFTRETPYAELQRLGVLDKQIIGPLRRLGPAVEVRVVIDALDRLSTGATTSVMAALDALAETPAVRLVVTARPDTGLPTAATIYELGLASTEQVQQYLDRRAVVPARQQEVIAESQGNWLVARVLADLLCSDPQAPTTTGQMTLGDAFDELLARCDTHNTQDLQVLLSVLAATDAGPLLPLALLCAASEHLGGPANAARVRDVLVALRGLVTRASAGTDDEHAGLFHQSFVDHVRERLTPQVRAAHRALVAGIELLVPVSNAPMDLSHGITRYAFNREAEHWWELSEFEKALQSLGSRQSPVPSDNLRRWLPWHSRVESWLGPDHPSTLTTRHNIAAWTGQCGDAPKALRMLQTLLPNRTHVLGPDHFGTLTTRDSIAYWTDQCGDARKALRLSKALLPDRIRMLGPDHPTTLTTRNNIAGWTGKCGDTPGALSLSKALMLDQIRVLGPDHPSTLTTRNNIAAWTGKCGDAPEALRLFERLLPDRTQVLGPDHPETLATRNNIASWTGESGDAPAALRLSKALLPDYMRVLGPDHPETLGTRNNIAGWTSICGDAPKALRLSEALLPDQTRVLGPDHPSTLTTRNNIAAWTDQCGDAPKALRLFKALLPDRTKVLGPHHPDTLMTRVWITQIRGRV